jgi:hypothetical protein
LDRFIYWLALGTITVIRQLPLALCFVLGQVIGAFWRSSESVKVGLFDSAAYPTSRSSFDNTDCTVLFTDGSVKCIRPEENEFGRDALVSTFLRYEDLPAEKRRRLEKGG